MGRHRGRWVVAVLVFLSVLSPVRVGGDVEIDDGNALHEDTEGTAENTEDSLGSSAYELPVPQGKFGGDITFSTSLSFVVPPGIPMKVGWDVSAGALARSGYRSLSGTIKGTFGFTSPIADVFFWLKNRISLFSTGKATDPPTIPAMIFTLADFVVYRNIEAVTDGAAKKVESLKVGAGYLPDSWKNSGQLRAYIQGFKMEYLAPLQKAITRARKKPGKVFPAKVLETLSYQMGLEASMYRTVAGTPHLRFTTSSFFVSLQGALRHFSAKNAEVLKTPEARRALNSLRQITDPEPLDVPTLGVMTRRGWGAGFPLRARSLSGVERQSLDTAMNRMGDVGTTTTPEDVQDSDTLFTLLAGRLVDMFTDIRGLCSSNAVKWRLQYKKDTTEARGIRAALRRFVKAGPSLKMMGMKSDGGHGVSDGTAALEKMKEILKHMETLLGLLERLNSAGGSVKDAMVVSIQHYADRIREAGQSLKEEAAQRMKQYTNKVKVHNVFSMGFGASVELSLASASLLISPSVKGVGGLIDPQHPGEGSAIAETYGFSAELSLDLCSDASILSLLANLGTCDDKTLSLTASLNVFEAANHAYTDAILAARQQKHLGLDGVYTEEPAYAEWQWQFKVVFKNIFSIQSVDDLRNVFLSAAAATETVGLVNDITREQGIRNILEAFVSIPQKFSKGTSGASERDHNSCGMFLQSVGEHIKSTIAGLIGIFAASKEKTQIEMTVLMNMFFANKRTPSGQVQRVVGIRSGYIQPCLSGPIPGLGFENAVTAPKILSAVPKPLVTAVKETLKVVATSCQAFPFKHFLPILESTEFVVGTPLRTTTLASLYNYDVGIDSPVLPYGEDMYSRLA